MDVETATMSEKGQIVIPGKIRKKINASKGTRFAVIGNRDTIVLKRLRTPTRMELLQELKSLTREITAELRGLGMSEEDVIRTALDARRKT